jgi:hypothetical protein
VSTLFAGETTRGEVSCDELTIDSLELSGGLKIVFGDEDGTVDSEVGGVNGGSDEDAAGVDEQETSTGADAILVLAGWGFAAVCRSK